MKVMRTSGFLRVRDISVIPYGLFESDEREADVWIEGENRRIVREGKSS